MSVSIAGSGGGGGAGGSLFNPVYYAITIRPTDWKPKYNGEGIDYKWFVSFDYPRDPRGDIVPYTSGGENDYPYEGTGPWPREKFNVEIELNGAEAAPEEAQVWQDIMPCGGGSYNELWALGADPRSAGPGGEGVDLHVLAKVTYVTSISNNGMWLVADTVEPCSDSTVWSPREGEDEPRVFEKFDAKWPADKYDIYVSPDGERATSSDYTKWSAALMTGNVKDNKLVRLGDAIEGGSEGGAIPVIVRVSASTANMPVYMWGGFTGGAHDPVDPDDMLTRLSPRPVMSSAIWRELYGDGDKTSGYSLQYRIDELYSRIPDADDEYSIVIDDEVTSTSQNAVQSRAVFDALVGLTGTDGIVPQKTLSEVAESCGDAIVSIARLDNSTTFNYAKGDGTTGSFNLVGSGDALWNEVRKSGSIATKTLWGMNPVVPSAYADATGANQVTDTFVNAYGQWTTIRDQVPAPTALVCPRFGRSEFYSGSEPGLYTHLLSVSDTAAYVNQGEGRCVATWSDRLLRVDYSQTVTCQGDVSRIWLVLGDMSSVLANFRRCGFKVLANGLESLSTHASITVNTDNGKPTAVRNIGAAAVFGSGYSSVLCDPSLPENSGAGIGVVDLVVGSSSPVPHVAAQIGAVGPGAKTFSGSVVVTLA